MAGQVSTILFPGAMLPLPQYMRDEFRRRSGYVNTNQGRYGQYGMDFSTKSNYDANYKGPQTAWIRFASNAIVDNRCGFVLHGGNGVESAYGMPLNQKSFEQVLGYDLSGKGVPHYLNSSIQPLRPPPGVSGIELSIVKHVYAKATIKWKCHSIEQLNYMAKYFFTPYVTIILEWGWNNFNPQSLLDIEDVGVAETYRSGGYTSMGIGKGVLGAYTNPAILEDAMRKSYGNYDIMIGHIINFNYAFDQSTNTFNCNTEIASNANLYTGYMTCRQAYSNRSDDGRNQSIQVSFSDYFETDFCKQINYVVRANETEKSNYALPILNKLVSVDGRVFSFNSWKKVVMGDDRHASDDYLYMSFDLFTDILDAFFGVQSGSTVGDKQGIDSFHPFSLDIRNVRVGAHKNIISNSIDFLIPNAFAPYPTSFDLSKEETKFPGTAEAAGIARERVIPYLSKKVDVNSNAIEDRILIEISGKNAERQDLNEIINRNRPSYSNRLSDGTSAGIGGFAFPTLNSDVSDKQKKYCGYLKDIYLNVNLVREAVKQTTLSGILTFICNRLNEKIKIWDLEVLVNPKNPNSLSIVDNRYFDVDVLKSARGTSRNVTVSEMTDLVPLRDDEPLLYYFDTFSQNSIVTGFDFNVKLTDRVATMVINQVNRNYNSGASNTNTNIMPVVKERGVEDRILSNFSKCFPAMSPVASVPFDKMNAQDRQKHIDDLKSTIKNINSDSLYYEKQLNGQSCFVRLTLPQEKTGYFSKLMDEGEDTSPYNTNVSTMPIPGTTVKLSMLGISGFKTFQVFGVENLPEPYRDNVLFKITDVKHVVDVDQGWITTITAMILYSNKLKQILQSG